MLKTLRAKMRAALGALLLFTVALGGFAIDRLSVVNDKSTEMETLWLPRANALNQINTLTSDYRIEEGTHVLSITEEAMAEAESEMAETLKAIEDRFDAYRKLVHSDAGRATLDTAHKDWVDYLSRSREVIALSRRGENEKATEIFRSTEPLFDAMSDKLTKLAAYDTEQAGKASKEGDETYAFSRALVIAGLTLVAALILGVIVFFERAVAGAIARITGDMARLADGDLSVDVAGRERGDEIGAMARSVQVFKDNAVKRRALEAEQKAEQEARLRRADAVDRLVKDFDGTVQTLLQTVNASVTQLNATAQSMAAIAEETNREAASAAAASEQTSANVQTVASAAEEMSGSIGEIGRQVANSTQIAGQAVQEADRTNASVGSLAEAAQRIGDVVQIINTIAGQTNLLALNATIEAARAGEAGKGFAVVASEVKALASQTAKATEEIGGQVNAIQQATQGAVEAIRTIGGTIGTMNDISVTVAAAIEEQAAATQEISRNVQQAAVATQEVSASVVQVTLASDQTGAAASQVLSAARQLAEEAQGLRGAVDRFLTGIRAA